MSRVVDRTKLEGTGTAYIFTSEFPSLELRAQLRGRSAGLASLQHDALFLHQRTPSQEFLLLISSTSAESGYPIKLGNATICRIN